VASALPLLSAFVSDFDALWQRSGKFPRLRSSATTGEMIVPQLLMRLVKDETGGTAIEYGLIAAGVALAVIGVVSNLGSKLKSTFSSISTQLH
jgi:pilus assembly protein Flp/PilA